jgi:hypothetical protein
VRFPIRGCTLDATPARPQAAGALVTFTAVGEGGSGIYEYRFYLRDPAAGTSTSLGSCRTIFTPWRWNGVVDYFFKTVSPIVPEN